MIKFFLLFLLLTSCSARDYIEAPIVIYQTIKGSDLDITESFVNSKEFSFIKINIGRNIVATMTLSKIDNEVYEWVGADSSQRIYTKYGKIIRTVGLDHDFEILDSSSYKIDDKYRQYFLRFYDPTGMFLVKIENKIMNIFDYNNQWFIKFNPLFNQPKFSAKPIFVILERFETEGFRWSGRNTYWLDENKNIIKSSQSIHPYLPKINIDYYYKY